MEVFRRYERRALRAGDIVFRVPVDQLGSSQDLVVVHAQTMGYTVVAVVHEGVTVYQFSAP